MTATRMISALALVLALAGQPVLAQHRGGGRSHGGGGHHGGSYAVPRGGSPGGGGAYGRHPRAGTGWYGGHGGYYGGGHHGGYGHGGYGHGGYYGGYYGHGYYGHRHGYYPYYGYGYGYGYYPYYGYGYYGYPYASLYFGWPYFGLGFGWSGGSGGYSAPYYDSAPNSSAPRNGDSEAPRADERSYDDREVGRLRLDVSPEDASVYVDDAFWGNAREARSMTLRAGRHSIELVRPGFETVRRDLDIAAGATAEVAVEMHRR